MQTIPIKKYCVNCEKETLSASMFCPSCEEKVENLVARILMKNKRFPPKRPVRILLSCKDCEFF